MKFESAFSIGEEVEVGRYPEVSASVTDQVKEKLGGWLGQVVAVRFTKSKIYYDILADQDTEVYHNIDSINVVKFKEK